MNIINDSNDSNEYDKYDEYDGLNEYFREENNVESTELIFGFLQYPQELYEDYIDRLMNHINRQLTLSFRNYTLNP